ncbi:dienelactone hydrolase family protein-like protein [Rhizodiscina lignyota]|uniref:Dienelactone hydrolase family protein-like protein n=1 Tax=Rhizodiscina lignyota TaxID=1504668 RepID=A0A9P4IFG2_9PEZI|nr:dienelactone hydrolase family protein-like protein [Rhizodiscina lignyota]
MSKISPLHSNACCTVPPVVSKGYKEKGEWITVDGMKTYVTGPADAKKAILVVYDIFGFFHQTLQGADIMAYGDHEQPYKVFMPDFFEGSPADISWYPPDNEEKGKKLGEFFQTLAAPPKTLPRIPKVVEELKGGAAKGISDWGIVGYCWGAKIIKLSSMEGTVFKAAAGVHPAMVDPADAEKITIPLVVLPSMDEDKDAIAKFEQNLKVPHSVEWFPDQVHGFMAARSDLEDPKVKKEYERGYKHLLDFFHAHL